MLAITRRPALLARLGLSESAADREIRDGFLPPPIRLSPDPNRRAVGWPEYEIDEIAAARIAGLGPDESRALVADLIERRSRAREAA